MYLSVSERKTQIVIILIKSSVEIQVIPSSNRIFALFLKLRDRIERKKNYIEHIRSMSFMYFVTFISMTYVFRYLLFIYLFIHLNKCEKTRISFAILRLYWKLITIFRQNFYFCKIMTIMIDYVKTR